MPSHPERVRRNYRLRRFKYQDTSGEYIITEEEIKNEYFNWWSNQMKNVAKEDLISLDNCIIDWIIVHWAEEIF